MKRILLFTLTCCLAAGLPTSTKAQNHLFPLRVLHWNDFHARNTPYSVTVPIPNTQRDTSYLVGGSAALLGYINKFRSNADAVLVLNAGDDFQGTPISTLTLGRSQIELMNIIRPDAMVLGNHEFDYGTRSLTEHLRIATFPVLAANLYDTNRQQTYAASCKITTFQNLKVGILGIVPPDLERLAVPDSIAGLRILPLDSVVAVNIAQLRSDSVDLVMILSHMGYQADVQLAQRFPSIDLIVGGHDHRVISQPEKVNRTLIMQAGSWGRWLGKVDLLVDTKGDSIFSYFGELVETRVSDIIPDPVAAQKVEEFESSTRATMSELIGKLETPWRRPPPRKRAESNIGNWQADVMRAFASTDVAFQNVGGIRDNLPTGPITVGDIWRINPFGNHFVRFRVTGSELISMLQFQLAASLREQVQIAGLRITYDSRKPDGQKLLSVSINGKPIDKKQTYSIVTNNYVASNLHSHFGVDPRSLEMEDLPGLDRDIFIQRIRQDRSISSTVDGRMKDIAGDKKQEK